MSTNEPERHDEGNDNEGNQYDNPNQQVVGTDIASGEGNEPDNGNEPQPVQPQPPVSPPPPPQPVQPEQPPEEAPES